MDAAAKVTSKGQMPVPKAVRDRLEPTLTRYDIAGARYFHLACDLLTVVFLGAAEVRRRRRELPASGAA